MRQYLLSEMSCRAGRTLSTGLGVALGVALFIAVSAVSLGFREAARRPLAGVGADILLSHPTMGKEATAAVQTTRGVRMPFGISTLTVGDATRIQQIKDVESVAGALLLWDFGATNYQTVIGVDVNQPAVGPAKASKWIVAGRFLQSNDTRMAVADNHYAAFFSLKPGSQVVIGGEMFQVVGVVEAQEGSQAAAANLYIPLAEAQTLAHLKADALNQIYVRVAHASSVDDVVMQSRTALGEVNATTEQSIVQVMGGIALISQQFADMASLVALMGGLALTGFALSATVAERRQEIGVMKAVGWTAKDVRRYFFAEGSVLSFVGAMAGIVLGWLATLALGSIPVDLSLVHSNAPISLAVATVTPATIALPAQITPVPVIVSLGVATIGGAFASVFVARRAANMKPTEALRR